MVYENNLHGQVCLSIADLIPLSAFNGIGVSSLSAKKMLGHYHKVIKVREKSPITFKVGVQT